jgi:hypothetical protein
MKTENKNSLKVVQAIQAMDEIECERPSHDVTKPRHEVCLLLPEIRKILLGRLKATQSEQSKCRYKISES